MTANPEKENFLINEYILRLRTIDEKETPVWGKMNVHQMIEHMADSVRIATEKSPDERVVTPPERMEATYQFLMSDKPFKENTRNAFLPEVPPPVRNEHLEDAILELDAELTEFQDYFRTDPDKRTINAFFGHLNYAEWVQLLHKHALHHLRQFGAV